MKLLSFGNNNLDELVFANRNKSYGAYNLRKSYDSHMVTATLIAAGLFIFLLLFVQIRSLFPVAAHDIKVDDPIILGKVSNLELILTPQPKPNPPTARLETKTNSEGVMKITVNPVEKKIQTTSLVETSSAVGKENPTGETGPVTGNEKNGVPVPVQAALLEQESNAPELFPEQMPEFPGGMEGLSRFLKTNLHYPSAHYSNDLEGKVMVSFVVEKDGSVTHAMIEKAMGYGYDDEALRVIGMMPKWTPGKQNGKIVSVKFTLPVIFVLR